MIRVFDFECVEDHVTEHFVASDIDAVACPICGQRATKKLSAPRAKLEGITGDFPGAHLAWERKRDQKRAQELKRDDYHTVPR